MNDDIVIFLVSLRSRIIAS